MVASREIETRQATYDLALAEADYDLWEGPPARCILLCTHPRCGSTLLGEAMTFAQGLGCPIEYFHCGFRPQIERRWGVTGEASYLRALYHHRIDRTGTLGVKLFWRDVIDLCKARRPNDAQLLSSDLAADPTAAAEVCEMVRQIFTEIFPNATYIFLIRKDRLRLAVSAVTSAQTGVWRDIPGVDSKMPARTPEYDYERLLQAYGHACYSFDRWEDFFQRTTTEPYRLTYEALLGNYQATVERLLTWLEAATTVVPPPRMRRQSSALSEQFLARFLREDHSPRA